VEQSVISTLQTTRRRKASRPARINRIAAKVAERAKRAGRSTPARPLRLSKRKGRQRRIIAYDLETTRIKAGSPRPVYLTAYGADFSFSGRIDSFIHLRDFLVARFLVPEFHRARFVAWNGNKYDVFFVGAALLHSSEYLLRPYLTRTKALRGLKVIHKETKQEWEFLDGLAMTLGAKPCTLKEFLKTFAPNHHKLDAPDWEREEFDARNPAHVAYAERDSEGLYHGMMRAEQILQEHFGQTLQPTIGNLGIRLFAQHMPAGVEVWAPSYQVERIIRDRVMRGGFCFCSRKYQGPIWKYDINQAYAAAMRDALLPAGRCIQTTRHIPDACAIYRVNGSKAGGRVPFYLREATRGSGIVVFDQMTDAWITSIEYDQLSAEGWELEVLGGFYWDSSFSMRDYVQKLEALRINAPGGPKSAQGEMMKAIGNNSYGKTVEELGGYELVMAAEKPEGFFQYLDGEEPIQHIWFRFAEPQSRDYHQPQIGAFITAHVRMQIRRAILQAPDAWLYSDTDCCMYSRAVDLPIDAGLYGLWKIECEGEHYRIITKKVYAAVDGSEMKAKGMTTKKLSMQDFADWYDGKPPTIRQTQRQNFIAVMAGADMFVDRIKVGQRL
jgi:hypothetical protein